MLSHVGARLGHVIPCVCGRCIGACWGQVGVTLGHVEAVLGLFGVKGEPSWSFLRPCCIIALLLFAALITEE